MGACQNMDPSHGKLNPVLLFFRMSEQDEPSSTSTPHMLVSPK